MCDQAPPCPRCGTETGHQWMVFHRQPGAEPVLGAIARGGICQLCQRKLAECLCLRCGGGACGECGGESHQLTPRESSPRSVHNVACNCPGCRPDLHGSWESESSWQNVNEPRDMTLCGYAAWDNASGSYSRRPAAEPGLPEDASGDSSSSEPTSGCSGSSPNVPDQRDSWPRRDHILGRAALLRRSPPVLSGRPDWVVLSDPDPCGRLPTGEAAPELVADVLSRVTPGGG